MPSQLPEYPIVLVCWRDAISEEAVEPHTAVEPRLVELYEVGFLIGESAEAITLGMEISRDDDIEPGRFRLHIPRVSLVSVEPLTRKRARRPVPARVEVAGLVVRHG